VLRRKEKLELQQQAEEVWRAVLDRMPEEHQHKFALTECFRNLPPEDSAERADYTREVLERLDAETFNRPVPPPRPEPTPLTPYSPPPLSEAEALESMKTTIAGAMSAPTDGSKDRAEVLKQRGLGLVLPGLESGGQFGWLARRRLRRQILQFADELAAEISVTPEEARRRARKDGA